MGLNVNRRCDKLYVSFTFSLFGQSVTAKIAFKTNAGSSHGAMGFGSKDFTPFFYLIKSPFNSASPFPQWDVVLSKVQMESFN